ncbi:DMT family transporter [Nocardia sp. alder85J]|uniref:DMT family transporter n=1 Tax=Nocardia sp. alder85J TaxID=2862949 RepID=UPI001CD3407C|nr:DMT family transporter [Nocardia sp. alder85J]MCX4091149.1 DMT family transporter [Nocardia sp. alder85J]
MNDRPIIAVVCAFAGALLFAVAAVAQQRAAADVPEGEALLARLIRSPRWWAGLIGDAGGFAFQVAALAFGSVLVVQPILVTALVFALPLAAHYSGRRVTVMMWVQAAALSVALAVFLVVGDPTEGVSSVSWRHWVLPLAVMLVVVAIAVTVATVSRVPALQALLLGAAAGLLFGLSSALTEYVTQQFGHGLPAVLSCWQLYAVVITGVSGLYLQQRGYQVGPLAASFPAFTVAEPLGAAVIGLTVLAERLRSGPLGTAFVLLAVLVMCVEAVRLSQEQARTQEPAESPAGVG